MTEPELVEVQIPPEQLVAGDRLENPHDPTPRPLRTVERVIADAVPEFVYAFTPEQVPLRRTELVTVHRPRRDPVGPAPVTADDLAAVRDLALALAEQAPAATKAKIAAHVDRVKGRKP